MVNVRRREGSYSPIVRRTSSSSPAARSKNHGAQDFSLHALQTKPFHVLPYALAILDRLKRLMCALFTLNRHRTLARIDSIAIFDEKNCVYSDAECHKHWVSHEEFLESQPKHLHNDKKELISLQRCIEPVSAIGSSWFYGAVRHTLYPADEHERNLVQSPSRGQGIRLLLI